MKNSFVARVSIVPLALVLMAGVALQPVQSDAAIVGTAVVVAGSVFNALGVAALVSGAVAIEEQSERAFEVGMFICLFGAVLDDSGQQKVVLKPITDEFARKANVSLIEQESYNHDLDLIQATFDDISAQVAPLPDEERTPHAEKLWNEYRSAFAPESFGALKKVVAYAANQVR